MIDAALPKSGKTGHTGNCQLKMLPLRKITIFVLVAIAVGFGALTISGSKVEQSTPCSAPLSDDAIRGRAWAPTCKGCHDISPIELDLKHSSGGPNLQRVYMSLAGTQSAPKNPTAAFQYPYPPLAAARDAGVVWTDQNLFAYLRDPKGFLDNAAGKSFSAAFYMSFFIGQESERRDVIAYLKMIKDRPECD